MALISGKMFSGAIRSVRGICSSSRRRRLVDTTKRTVVRCKFDPDASNLKLTAALTELTTAQNASSARLTAALTDLTIAQKSWGQTLLKSIVAQALFVGAVEGTRIALEVTRIAPKKKSPEE